MKTMKKMITFLAVLGMVLALAPAADAVTPLTSANVSYSGQDITSIVGLNFNIEAPSNCVYTTYNRALTIKDTGVDGNVYTSSGTPSPGDQLHITDLDIDTGWSFSKDETSPDGVFFANLSNSITATVDGELNEVALILFESGDGDSPTVRAYNGATALGTALQIIGASHWGDTGATSYILNATSGKASVAAGISLADLGVTTGQTVTRFEFFAPQNWDPTEIMVDSNLSSGTPAPPGTVLIVK
jgi:hypothetical protein